MTPAVIESPVTSPSPLSSSEATDARLECRDVQDPLVVGPGLSYPLPSFLLSPTLSLCSFFPKKDLPADDCRACLSAGVVEGIVVLWGRGHNHGDSGRNQHRKVWQYQMQNPAQLGCVIAGAPCIACLMLAHGVSCASWSMKQPPRRLVGG
jgi:hypothetical protein